MSNRSEIMTIIGTRPQIIKAMYMSQRFEKEGVNEIVVNTGQHYDYNMDEVFYTTPVKHNLNIKNHNPNQFLIEVRQKTEGLFKKYNPRGVVVYGDTLSTLAGAMVAYVHKTPLFHIEAGLRSGDSTMSEEVNRIITDTLACRNYCPTNEAVLNLKREGLEGIHTGDLMVEIFNNKTENISKTNNPYILATIHRKENTDDPHRMWTIFQNLSKLSRSTKVIMPLHPRTRQTVKQYNLSTGDIEITEPVNLNKMYELLCGCDFVVTDSGGLQREAYLAKKECFVVRTSNEWKGLLNHGNQSMVNLEGENPFVTFERKNRKYKTGLLGEGKTSGRIIKDIKESVRG
jgi:UDP-GlcNAc3NAcA epimerase